MSQFDRGGGKLLPLNASVPFRGTAFTPQSASPPVTNMYPAALKHLNTILSFLFFMAAKSSHERTHSFCWSGSTTAPRVKKSRRVRLRVRDPAVEHMSARKPAPLLRKEPLERHSAVALHFSQLSPRHGHKNITPLGISAQHDLHLGSQTLRAGDVLCASPCFFFFFLRGLLD